MQTFLPCPSFIRTSEVLDNKRLGKQRVEAMQILHTLALGDDAKGWKNHPIVKMWRGYDACLRCYHDIIVSEWMRRGFVNNMPFLSNPDDWSSPNPPWFGDPGFHSSHRQTLLFKDFKWYSRFGWKEEPKYEYKWMVP